MFGWPAQEAVSSKGSSKDKESQPDVRSIRSGKFTGLLTL